MKSNITIALLFTVGLLLWNMTPPQEITPQGWHITILFVETIICLTLAPLPVGAVTVIVLTIATLTNTLPLSKTLSGFSSDVVWLIVAAFLLAKGFENTGLGKRIAYYIVAKFGSSVLKLSYCFVFVDFILSPMIPSAISRGGGIVYPILRSLLDTAHDDKGPHFKRMATFLIQTSFHTNVVTSALFLTAMAANPLMLSFAKTLNIDITWSTWAIAAIVPGVTNLMIMPLVLFYLIKPKDDSIEHLRKVAKQHVDAMSPLSSKEIIMGLTFVVTITLWITGHKTGIHPTTVALIGSSILLLTRVLTWNDAISEKSAWDSFVWFGAILTLSNALSEFGITTLLSDKIEYMISDYSTVIKITSLIIIFFLLHYLFASITAYISVMYTPFLIILVKAGVAPVIAALYLGFIAILSASLTHYSIGSAPIFYSSGCSSTKEWWSIGLIISVMNLLIWTVVGAVWWRLLGWW